MSSYSIFSLMIAFAFSASAPAKELELKIPPGESCPSAFAKLANSKTPFVAVSVGAHLAVGGAMLSARSKKEGSKQTSSAENSEETMEEFFAKRSSQSSIPLLSKEEIIKRSQENLVSWKKNRAFIHPLGELLIHSEMHYQGEDKNLLSDSLENYREDQTHLKEMKESHRGNKAELIDQAVVYLYDKYITRYCGQKGFMTSFYGDEKCGNCQSNTKLILANLIDAGIEPPLGTKFAAQLYSDHIAPVLYEERSGKTLDLTANEFQEKPVAPIYEPSIILDALLQKERKTPSLSLDALLIAKGSSTEKEKEELGTVASNTDFRGGSGSFGGGAPDFVRTSRGRTASAFGHSQGKFLGAYSNYRPDDIEVRLNPNDPGFKNNYFETLLNPQSVERDPEKLVLVVRSEKTKQYCESVIKKNVGSGVESCTEFAQQLAMNNYQKTPAWELLRVVAENPTFLQKLSESETKTLINELQAVYALTGSVRNKNSEIRALRKDILSIDEKAQKDPEKFLTFLTSLSKEKLTLLKTIFSDYLVVNLDHRGISGFPENSLKGLQVLSKSIRDDKLVGPMNVGSDAKENEYMLTFYGDGKGTWEKAVLEKVPDPKLASGKGKEEGKAQSNAPSETKGDYALYSEAKMKLSAEKLAGLALFVPPPNSSNSEKEKDYLGLAKFFSEPVMKESIETRNFSMLNHHYQNLAQDYFRNLVLSNNPTEKEEFERYFSGQKFFKVIDHIPRRSELGVYPEYMAKFMAESIAARNRYYSSASQPHVFSDIPNGDAELIEVLSPLEYFSKKRERDTPGLSGPYPATRRPSAGGN